MSPVYANFQTYIHTCINHWYLICSLLSRFMNYLRLRSPSDWLLSLISLALSSVASDSRVSRNLATSSFPSDLAISKGNFPSLSLMDSNALSLASSFAASRLPWKAAQCNAFHPSTSTMAGSPPSSLTCRIALAVPLAFSPASTMRGVHPFSFVRKLQFFLVTDSIKVPISALFPASQVSNMSSSKLPVPPPTCLTTGFPLSSTISSSGVNSLLVFSSNILSSGRNPLPMSNALTIAFSNKLSGPIIVWMAKPMAIPLYRCSPTVRHIPKRVEPSKDRAVDAMWAPY
mmetsp:Transcript_3442/g.5468  ORF Transcript_3442/g.5468 Transcript_3442/m.5468 type:complete len:287 (+) Transcript_3442:1995-2855(+)